MSYNGSGTFNINTTGQPVVAGTVITASAFNALTADLATGLTTAITKDGQTTTTARITFAQGVTSSLVTDSSSISTGSIITGGGVGIAKALYVGTTANVAGDASISGLTVGKGGGSVSTNTAVGASALNATTGSSSNNSAFGSAAGSALTSGSRNTALGFNALLLNTTGNENTAVGGNSLNKSTTPSGNTAVGYVALYENTTGASNTAVGNSALQNNTTASNNTAVGYQAGYGTTTAQYNVFVGSRQGTSGNGDGNTIIGDFAGNGRTSGTFNAFFGQSSGYLITTGSKNTILGSYGGNQGGLDIRTASNYIVLSDGDGNPRGYFDSNGSFVVNGTAANAAVTAYSTSTNQAFWGKSTVSGSPTSVLWNSGTSGDNSFETFYTEAGATLRGSISFNRAGGLVSYNTTSDYRAKTVNGLVQNALSKVSLLKPSTGRMNGATQDIDFFVAHELQEVVPSAVNGEKDAVNEDNTPKYQMVDKSALIPLLTAAIQELKQIVDTQAAEIAELKAKVGI